MQINLSSPAAFPSAQPGQSWYLIFPPDFCPTEILTLQKKQVSSGRAGQRRERALQTSFKETPPLYELQKTIQLLFLWFSSSKVLQPFHTDWASRCEMSPPFESRTAASQHHFIDTHLCKGTVQGNVPGSWAAYLHSDHTLPVQEPHCR